MNSARLRRGQLQAAEATHDLAGCPDEDSIAVIDERSTIFTDPSSLATSTVRPPGASERNSGVVRGSSFHPLSE